MYVSFLSLSKRSHCFLPPVVFLFSLLIMGKTRHCTGCKMPLSEHTFEKPGKSCSGPEPFPDVSVVEEDTAFPSQPLEDEPQETIEATLASLLGAVKSLTTGLKEVQADNQQLRALLTNKSPLKEVPIPSTSTGGARASGVTLPELHTTQDLSQQADRRVAQLGLVDSSKWLGPRRGWATRARPRQRLKCVKWWWYVSKIREGAKNSDYRPLSSAMAA